MNSLSRIIPLLVFGAVAVLLSGCIHARTEQDTLGGVVTLEAFEFIERAEPVGVATADVFDRTDWAEIMILAPNDQTTTLARFTSNPRLAKNSPRQRNEWPRAMSAVERDYSEKGLISEMLLEPFVAGLDVILIPFRTKSPQIVPYQRWRDGEGVMAEPLLEEEL